jgi:hypothetical protein
MTDRKLAKDVARELDRRRLRRKLFVLGAIVGLLILAFLYLRCGRGWGLGGGGKGDGTGSGTATATADAGPRRCALRISADGITVDGKAATRDEAVEACKTAGGAEVVVTGDATQGVWDELRGALDAAQVPSYLQRK